MRTYRWLWIIILLISMEVSYSMSLEPLNPSITAFNDKGDKVNVIETYDSNTGILTVTSKDKIINATLNIPANEIRGVGSYRLLVDGVPEKPYCKINNCYYDLKLNEGKWTFNVEHFTTYQVEQTGTFTCLSACLEWIYGTGDTCVLGSGYWDVRDCITNITDLRIGGDKWIANRLINNSPNETGISGDMLIGADMYTSAGIQRAVFKINDTVFDNPVLNGTITTKKMYFQAGTKRDLDPDNYFSLYLINESNVWNHLNTSWNWLNETTPWVGEPGCNEEGVDYNPENYTLWFGANNATGKYYGIDFPSYWFIGWKNGSIKNNGLFFKEEDDTDSYRRYVIWGGFYGYYTPYLELDVKNVEITARTKYEVLGTAIQIGSSNVTLNLSGVTIGGNNVGTGVYYYRAGGNITVINADVENFSACYVIDTYFDPCNSKTTNSKGKNCGNSFTGCQNTSYNNFTSASISYTEYGLDPVGYHHDIRIENLTGDQYFGMDQCLNDVFWNFYVASHDKTSKTVWISGYSNATLKNSIIIGDNTNRGVDLQQPNTNFINNTLQNFTTCIWTDNQANGDVIENNTLIGCGNSTTSNGYFMDMNPRTYNGNDYDYTGMYVHKGVGTLLNVNSDNKDVSAYFDGTQDGTLCLYDIQGAGAIYVTIIDTNADSCATLTAVLGAVYPGTNLDYYEDNVYQNNGAGNDYTPVFSASTTTTAGYSSPRLEHTVIETQLKYPLEVAADNMIIKGNTIYNSTIAEMYYSLLFTADSDNNNVTFNNFYYAGINDLGSGNLYCVGVDGNYYEESLTQISGDCGIVNVTGISIDSRFVNQTLTITLKDQSSLNKSLTYYLAYDGRIVSAGVPFTIPESETNITLIPFDGRFNATHYTAMIEDFVYGWQLGVGFIVFGCFLTLGFIGMNLGKKDGK